MNSSSLAAGSRPCVPSWEYGMPRASPISAGVVAELKWLEGRFLRSCGRSTSPMIAAAGLGRCGRLSRPIMTAPHRAGCRLTRFSSAGTPWVGDSPCQVKAWQWMPRSSSSGRHHGAGDLPAAQEGARLASQGHPEICTAQVQGGTPQCPGGNAGTHNLQKKVQDG